MRIGILITVLVYGLIYYFVGKAKMPTYGDYLNQKNAAGSPGQSYQRARTTVNTTPNTTQRTSAPVKPKVQQTAATRLPKPTHLNNSFGMGKEKDDYLTREKGKGGQGVFSKIGKNKEIDCDLDERIFGSKHQHKDVF
ncbi:MAG: hypothetical protein PHY44_00290 [Lachnospiraceae bacterium]|nr:hypothetical protein [Lachnospiraceae bacterium]